MGTSVVGYARVSTLDQKPELQLDALNAAGCQKTFVEKTSGAKEERPQLQAVLDYVSEGDTLVAWKLDRLARSMKQIIETVDQLKERQIGFRSLTEAIDTTTAARLQISPRSGSVVPREGASTAADRMVEWWSISAMVAGGTMKPEPDAMARVKRSQAYQECYPYPKM